VKNNNKSGGDKYASGMYGGGLSVLDYNATEIAKARIIYQGMPLLRDAEGWAEANYELAAAMVRAKHNYEQPSNESPENP